MNFEDLTFYAFRYVFKSNYHVATKKMIKHLLDNWNKLDPECQEAIEVEVEMDIDKILRNEDFEDWDGFLYDINQKKDGKEK